VLLVEDDPGDAYLVQELLEESGAAITLRWETDLARAQLLLNQVDCVLLDLGLPDAEGLGALRRVLAQAPGQAVLVLTGLADEHRGAEAVAAGAQDYIVKGSIDGAQLARSVRYAVERSRAEESKRRLIRAEARGEENARLERGLLPMPVLRTSEVTVAARYVPAGGQALLGGDFYDVVETPDSRVHVIVGDVCGHGPDEAALGVCLRVGWRSLVLAGVPDDHVLETLERLLSSERRSDEVFVTLAQLVVEPDRRSAQLSLAGHPVPLLAGAAPRALGEHADAPPLGVLTGVLPSAVRVALVPGEPILLFTDGLIEGRSGAGEERLGIDGLLTLLAEQHAAGTPDTELSDMLLAAVQAQHGGPLEDDVAVVLVSIQP
jgi:serine phosphatase RsbU (regulator of sigma subunit)